MNIVFKSLWKQSTTTMFVAMMFVWCSFIQSQDKSNQAKKITVAVLNFEARGGVSSDESVSLSEVFNSELVRTNEYQVVDRSRIKNILGQS